jgi:hypothetical protein
VGHSLTQCHHNTVGHKEPSRKARPCWMSLWSNSSCYCWRCHYRYQITVCSGQDVLVTTIALLHLIKSVFPDLVKNAYCLLAIVTIPCVSAWSMSAPWSLFTIMVTMKKDLCKWLAYQGKCCVCVWDAFLWLNLLKQSMLDVSTDLISPVMCVS